MTIDTRRDWSGRELAERLQITPRNLRTQLGEWAKLGFITRTGFAIYTLNTPPADTPSTTTADLYYAALRPSDGSQIAGGGRRHPGWSYCYKERSGVTDRRLDISI